MQSNAAPATPKKLAIATARKVPFLPPAQRAQLKHAFWNAQNAIEAANGSPNNFTEENLEAYPVPLSPLRPAVGNLSPATLRSGMFTPERPSAHPFGAAGNLPHEYKVPAAPKKLRRTRRQRRRAQRRAKTAKK